MNYLENVEKELVEHYARMALISGWVPYARHQVQEVLEKDSSGNWPDLYQKVKARMKEIENEN
jgi:hypothetical protein